MPGNRKPGSTGSDGFHEAVNDGTSALIASPHPASVGDGPDRRAHPVLIRRISHPLPVERVKVPVLHFDSRGPKVEGLQLLLNSRFRSVVPLKVDGIFGPKTEGAVLQFQKANNLKTDGIVGKKTWFALTSAPIPQAPRTQAKPSPAPQIYPPPIEKAALVTVNKPVPEWSIEERIEYVLKKSLSFMLPALADQVRAMFTGPGLAILVGSLALWAVGQFAGYGEAVDAFLIGFGLPFLGMAIFDVVKLLYNFLLLTVTAHDLPGLDEAANDFARALAIVAAAISIAKFFSALRSAANLAKGGAASAGAAAEETAAAESTSSAKPAQAPPKAKVAPPPDEPVTPPDEPPPSPSEKPVAFPVGGKLYRVDGRLTGTIFDEGFQPRGTATDLENYVNTNTPSNFVSTSKTPEIANDPAFGQPGKYVYMIDGSQIKGIDVNQVYPDNPFSSEQEIAVPGGIPKEAIMGAQPILPDGTLGDPIINPNYKGGGS